MTKRNILMNAGVLSITLIILLTVAEVIFRVDGKYATFNEKYGLPYHSLFDAGVKSWYHVYPPHEVTSQILKEYSYSILANNEGLLDNDFVIEKKPHSIRIMVIGDSFVQGMGAGTDSTCPRSLEGILRERYGSNPEIEVWNCGVGNSDPYFEYILFSNRLLKYNPDYVIELINSTDISDVTLRGGFERFNADSSVTYCSPPWYEPVYAKSFLFRRILHDVLCYNWLFMRPKQEAEAVHKSESEIELVLMRFRILCSAHKIPLLVGFHPRDPELNGTMKYSMQNLINFCDSVYIPRIDIKSCLEDKGFVREKSKLLYWPMDGHCNAEGYKHFAECLSLPVIQHLDSIQYKYN